MRSCRRVRYRDARLSTLLVAHDGPAARALAHALPGLVGVVVIRAEPPPEVPRPEVPPWRRLARRARRLLSGDDRIERARARLERDAGEAMRTLARGWPAGWPPVPVLATPTLATPEVVAFGKGQRAELGILFGAPIAPAAFLRVARLGFLNVHTSLLPSFRGGFPELWIVHDLALDRAGVTVHWAAARVDAGDLVAQRPVEASASIDPYTLRVRTLEAAVAFVPDVVGEVLAGRATRTPLTSSRLYRTRDFTPAHWRRLIRQLGRD